MFFNKSLFSNKGLNLLSFHFWLQILANNIGNIFLGIFLFNKGIELPYIFLIYWATYLLRPPLRNISIFFCNKYWLKKVMYFGILCYMIMFPLLGAINWFNIWMYLFILFSSLKDVFYWLPYHAYFSVIGDIEKRGSQTALREAVIQIANIIAPILGSYVSIYWFNYTFWLASIIVFTSAIPLYFTPEVSLPTKNNFREAVKKVDKRWFFAYLWWGIYDVIYEFTWKIVLFFSVGNLISFWYLLSLVVIFQMVGSFFIGSLYDRGSGKNTHLFWAILMGISIIGSSFLTLTIPVILFLNLIFVIGGVFSRPILISAFYNLSKKSGQPVWFQYFAELGWDLASFFSSILVALLLFLNYELQNIMIIWIIWLFITQYFVNIYFLEKKKLLVTAIQEPHHPDFH